MIKMDAQYIKKSDVKSMADLLKTSAETCSYYIITDEDGEPFKVVGCGLILADREMVNDIVVELEERLTPTEVLEDKRMGA